MNRFMFIAALAALLPAAVSSKASDLDSLSMKAKASWQAEEMIAGAVSGVDVSAAAGSMAGALDVKIRGIGSLSSDTQPLWVIDGVVMSRPADVDNPFWEFGNSCYTLPEYSMSILDVKDIESISVLKDVSATSIYGSAGANGVIIVTTKTGAASFGNGLRLDSRVDALSLSNNNSLSIGGRKGNTDYYISGFYSDRNSSDASSDAGGLRFNFRSKTNSAISLGMNASMGMGSISALNPVLPADADIDDNSTEYRTSDSFYITFNPGHGLLIRADAAMDYRVKRRYMWYGISTDLGAARNGAVSVSSMSLFNFNSSVNASLNRYFGKEHVIFELQADARNESPDYNVMCAYDFFDYSLRSKGLSLGASTSLNRVNAWNMLTAGGYAKLCFDHSGVIGTDMSVRYENCASGALRSVLYPSVSAFLDARKMLSSFGVAARALSTLRFDAGWGRAGLGTYVPYQWMDSYTQQCPAIDSKLQAFYYGFLYNDTAEFSSGLNLGFLEDRLLISARFYDRVGNDNLCFFCNGEEFGENGFWHFAERNTLFEEPSSVSNRGVELDLCAGIARTSLLKWDASLHVSFNSNKVLELPYTDSFNDSMSRRWMYSNIAQMSAHQLVGYATDDAGNLVDKTGDGKITPADMVALGATLPRYLVGASTSLSIGRFSFEAAVDGRFGAYHADIASLIAADAPGAPAKMSDAFVKSSDAIRLTRAVLSYDVPMGRFSDKLSLAVNAAYTSPLAATAFSPFAERKMLTAGVSLNF